MDPVSSYSSLIEAMKEGGPWIAMAAAFLLLYLAAEYRIYKLTKKQDEREAALRQLVGTIAGVNAKTEKTLDANAKAMIEAKSAQDKAEVRLTAAEKTLSDAVNRMGTLCDRVAELCGQHR